MVQIRWIGGTERGFEGYIESKARVQRRIEYVPMAYAHAFDALSR